MTAATREIVHVMRLLADFGVFLIVFTLFACEKQSSVKIATNSVFHKGQNTLRLIATSLVYILLQALYHSHIFAQRSRLQTSL